MAQEDKRLLLRDLCARLPYKVFVMVEGYHIDKIKGIDGDVISTDRGINYPLRLVKPYLRPMSSMTDEERLDMTKEIKGLKIQYFASSPWEWSVCGLVTPNTLIQVVDWLNAHHFDYRGLIEKGLAIEVTPENNPYK